MWTFSTFIIPAVYLYLYTSSYLNTNIIQISIQTSSTVMQDTFGTFCLQQSFLLIILSSTYRLQQRHQFGPIRSFCLQHGLQQRHQFGPIRSFCLQQRWQFGTSENFALKRDCSLESYNFLLSAEFVALDLFNNTYVFNTALYIDIVVWGY